MALCEFEYTFGHVPGKDNVLNDFFSRTPFPDTSSLKTNPNLSNSEQVLPVDIESVNTAQAIQSTSSEKLTYVTSPTSIIEILKSLNNIPDDLALEISNKTILKEQVSDPNLSRFYNDL